MTVDEFQKKYHEYCVDSYGEALAEAHRVNDKLEVNPLGHAIPVKFEGLGYCLMLEGAAEFVV